MLPVVRQGANAQQLIEQPHSLEIQQGRMGGLEGLFQGLGKGCVWVRL